MTRLLSVLAIFMLAGCTIMQPRHLPPGLADHCETRDCVVDAVDSIANDSRYPGPRFKIMEGYKDTKLRPMLEDGRLDIGWINPILVAIGPVFGYAVITAGKYGEVWKCSVRVMPWFDWSILIHELSHCQGYAERGPINIFWFMDQYTSRQTAIMKEEGAEDWVSTRFYKEKKYITPDYIH